MFMPFYVPARQAPRVLIVGGGYAGLAALVTLREQRPDAEITLVDPREHHIKITHLHETFRQPLERLRLRLPFALLEQRFHVRHVRASVDPDPATLARTSAEGSLAVGGEYLDFDYLIWATGAGYRRLEPCPWTLDLTDFLDTPGLELIAGRLAQAETEAPVISVVGGGATGIQFLFELADAIRERALPWRLRLIDAGTAPLAQFHAKLGRYVLARLQEQGIEYVSGHRFRRHEAGQMELERTDTGEPRTLPSHLALLFVGLGGQPSLTTNPFGQVVVEGRTYPRYFAAGDGTRYRTPGASNALSAQTALRKGRLVARNVLRHSGPLKLLEPWLHRDLGYVIGMGPRDAVGWLALPGNIVAGPPAVLLKEVVEAQYDLLLAGLDTYVL